MHDLSSRYLHSEDAKYAFKILLSVNLLFILGDSMIDYYLSIYFYDVTESLLFTFVSLTKMTPESPPL
ncbi:MAG: hypothetical protein ACTSYT_01925 [Candidatus Asgardarchaeia archaeon]